MSFGNDRQMYSVNTTCAQCGTAITELPFQPSGSIPVYCAACHRARRQNRPMGGGGGGMRSSGPRQMYDVDVECSNCHVKITRLPFQPTNGKPVYCKDCLMAQRAQA